MTNTTITKAGKELFVDMCRLEIIRECYREYSAGEITSEELLERIGCALSLKRLPSKEVGDG